MVLWIGRDEHRKEHTMRRRIESALAADHVDEIRVATAEAVALDELEDLGEACAFQVDPDRILFSLRRCWRPHKDLRAPR